MHVDWFWLIDGDADFIVLVYSRVCLAGVFVAYSCLEPWIVLLGCYIARFYLWVLFGVSCVADFLVSGFELCLDRFGLNYFDWCICFLSFAFVVV